jgi:amidase
VTELHYLSLGEVCARIKGGALSAREVTEHQLDRIRRLDGDLDAYVMVLAEEALDRAEALDRDREAGKPLGLLHGVPIALKDILYTAGHATAAGTTVLSDFVPDFDGTVVARLKEAGAVVIGKTRLTEGAYGVHHPDLPAPKNPWDAERWPGVSSSGSGVAVAAGLCFGAIGSDTGGSIRFPSASCGTVGLKPTYGRVSRHGVFPLAPSLDHVGPMTRTVADAGRMLQAMAGQDPADPTTLADPVPNYLSAAGAVAAASVGAAGLRIGIDEAYVSRGVETPVVEAVTAALGTLESLGAVVVKVRMPESYAILVQQWGITCAVECARAHADLYPARRDEYGPVLAELIDLGRNAPQDAYQALEQRRVEFRSQLDGLFAGEGGIDCLIAPNMPYLAPPADGVLELSADPDRANGLTFTAPFDYSGHPTLSLPAGVSGEGLPLSFQLIGPRLGESVLLQAGGAYEAAAAVTMEPIP